MNNPWLWYYTHSVNPDAIESGNEQRAFALYSRWRSVCHWIRRRLESRLIRGQKLATLRDLSSLSDHMLRDIGLLRTGDSMQLRKPYQLPEPPVLASKQSEVSPGKGAPTSIAGVTTGVTVPRAIRSQNGAVVARRRVAERSGNPSLPQYKRSA